MIRRSDNCGDSDLLSISQAFLMPTDSVTEGDTQSAFITLIWRSQLGLASAIDFTQSILIQTYYRTNFQYYKKRFLESSRGFYCVETLTWTLFHQILKLNPWYKRINIELFSEEKNRNKKNIKTVNLIRIFKILSTFFFITANFFNETASVAKFRTGSYFLRVPFSPHFESRCMDYRWLNT